MDPLSLLVGGALLVAGWLVGRRTRPSRDPYRCSCGHSLATHDEPTGPCRFERERLLIDDVCSCVRYVGPLPPVELDPADVLRALGSDRPTE